jgi:peptidoglycan/LPS O-acetylase OafA/YrhL
MQTESRYYRPDIDGLRAVALLQVVLFHAGFSIAKSGFVGVDIFFVISGFLITGILLKMQTEGTYKLRDFYERRIRRILPVLLLVILVSVPFAYLLMLPDDLENFGQSQIAGIFSANNLLLWLTENYFSVRNEFKPLVHTWSLGVEEQFYLFYPLIFIFAYKLRGRISIVFSLMALWFASFSLAVWCSLQVSSTPQGVDNLNVASFYLLPTRAFELLTGALALFVLNKFDIGSLSDIRRSVVKVIGFLIIISSGVILPTDSNYPNFWTLFPLLGTFMFLLVRTDRVITPLISTSLMLRLGLASYSIYLIHQPIFAFYRLSKFEAPTTFEYVLLALTSIFLGLLSFKYFESPFRKKDIFSYRKVISILTIMSILILVSGSQFVAKAGYFRGAKFFPVQQTLHRGVNAEFNLKPFAYKKDAFIESNKVQLLVFGNSQARDFINALGTTSKSDNYEILYRDDFNGCIDEFLYESKMLSLITDSDYVVFGSSPEEKCWNKFLHDWTRRASTILVLGEKNFGRNVNAVMLRAVNNKTFVDVRKDVQNRNIRAQRIFRENYVDLNGLIGISNSRVPILDSSGFLISQDGTHLTPKGAEFLGKKIENSIRFDFTN